MPARTKNTYTVPGKGVVNTKRKTFAGRGRGPAGTRKTRPATAATAPTTIVKPSGAVTTSGMGTAQQMAKAVIRQKRSRSRVADAVLAASRRSSRQRQSKRSAISDAPFTKAQLHPYEKSVGENSYSPDALMDPIRPRPSDTRQVRREAAEANRTVVPEFNKLTAKSNAELGKRFSPSAPAALPGVGRSAATALISSVPGKDVNLKGTKPERRQARKKLRRAKKAVRASGVDTSGLSPAEAEVARLATAAHRKYPDVPVALAMAQVKQESGFNAAAVSSAGAQGLTQFIPSTASSYDVEYGTGKKEKRSQVFGQFKLMHDNGVGENPTLALNNYLGLHGQTSPSDYSSNILAMAKEYDALSAAGANPKALRHLKAAKAQAEQLGLKVGGGKATSPAPPKLVKRVVIAEHAMKEIEGQPYIWGGGHGSFTEWGKDCSGAVSYVVHKVAPNLLKAPLGSGAMGSVLKPGPGALTVFYNDTHTFLRLINSKGEAEYWGTSVGDSGAGGLTRHPAPSSDYLAQYNVGHVPGMGRKQALQLGADPSTFTSATSFPGMTLSSSGTTATINPGAGVERSKAGGSKRPIKLTPLQKYNKAKRELRQLGVPLGGGRPKEPETHPVLQELIEKYGSPPVPATAAARKSKALAAAGA